MAKQRKPSGFNVVIYFSILTALVACGRNEDASSSQGSTATVVEPDIASNPEAYAQGDTWSDTVADVNVESDLGVQVIANDSGGLLITDIAQDSPGAGFDLEKDDVITHFNGARIDAVEDFQQHYKVIDTGISFEITVVRDGNARTVDIIKS